MTFSIDKTSNTKVLRFDKSLYFYAFISRNYSFQHNWVSYKLDFLNIHQFLPNKNNLQTYRYNFVHRRHRHCTDYNSCDNFRSYKKDSFDILHFQPNSHNVDFYQYTMDLALVLRWGLGLVLQLGRLLELHLCHHNSF